MENTDFNYYNIDLADIWDYERGKFMAGDTNEILAQKIINLIQLYVLKHGEPSFGEEMIHNDSKYYKRIVSDYIKANLEMKYALDYFIHKSNCYQYCQSIIITKNEKDFNFFFALKMRQYNSNLFEVHNFLKYHLINTFLNESKSYINYLNTVLYQYSDLICEGLRAMIGVFITDSESHGIRHSNSSKIKNRPKSKKDYTSYFKTPEYIEQFVNVLKDKGLFDATNKFIGYFKEPKNEIQTITTVLFNKGYLSKRVIPSHNYLFANALNFPSTIDDKTLRKTLTWEPSKEMMEYYESIIPNPKELPLP